MSENVPRGRHVVVDGGGFAGLGAAYTLRRRLRPEDRVTLIEPSGRFVFAPSLVWAVLGRSLYYGSFAREPALRKHGIAYRRSTVREVRVDAHVVVIDEGEMPYDRLLIATGGRPNTTAIPGLAGEFRSAHWIVGKESALDVRLLDGGSAGLLLASWGTRELRSVAMLLPRSVAHYLKALQERYLVWRLRMGRMELP